MRRKVFAITALLALVACGVAYAASSPDNFTASLKAPANGSAKKPAATSIAQAFSIKNKTSGDNADPATNINVKLAKAKVVNGSSDPKCTPGQIEAAGGSKWNKVCKTSSLVASGKVVATLYAAKHPNVTGTPCHLSLDVYNQAANKLTFVLDVANSPTACDGLSSDDAKPWTATYKEESGSLDINIPLPADVSTNAGNIGLWAAIDSETLNWKKKVDNKPLIESTGCTANKRSYEYQFQVTTGSAKSTADVKGTSAC